MEIPRQRFSVIALTGILLAARYSLVAMNNEQGPQPSLGPFAISRKIEPADSSKLNLNEIGLRMNFHYKSVQLYMVDFKQEIRSNRTSVLLPKGTVLSVELPNTAGCLNKVYYQVDNAPKELYTDALRLVAHGQHNIRILIVDSKGKEYLSEVIKFRITE